MWLRAATRRVLARSLAVALAALVCGGTVDWGHAGGDDRDCETVLVLHDHTAHRLGAAQADPTAPASHCYICHSLRVLGTMLAARNTAATIETHSRPLHEHHRLAVIVTFES